MNNFIERRAYARIPFRDQVPLGIQGREQPLTVLGVDLSHGGACINVPMTAPLAEGSNIRVSIPRPGPQDPATARDSAQHDARVVRVDRASRLLEGLAVVGLQFN